MFEWEPAERFDLVFFSFWLSHVPEERFDEFWSLVRAALGPEGRVFLVDSGAGDTAHTGTAQADGEETRSLSDGRTFRIVKRRWRARRARGARAAARLRARPPGHGERPFRLRRRIARMTAEELLAQADAAASNAYAPYSNYHVGAAVLVRDGRVFAGANVENAAYPLGVCAERSAIAKAASEGLRPGEVEAIAITASPCGGCRQWLHEWRFERVHFRRSDGTVATYAPDELLPETWDLPEG